MSLQAKVERCLANEGEFKVSRPVQPPICGYGTPLPCKYQGMPVETLLNGQKTGNYTFPCVYGRPPTNDKHSM